MMYVIIEIFCSFSRYELNLGGNFCILNGVETVTLHNRHTVEITELVWTVFFMCF